MTLLYYDPIFLEHDTGDHPEHAGRILPVVRHLRSLGLDTRCTQPTWDPATSDRLCYVHSRDYVESVKHFALRGGGRIEADTVLSGRSSDAARMAAGAVCDAVVRVVNGEDKNAFCLVRPPGHHALPEQAMGFCLFNNVAVAARVATNELGVRRVLIVDFDVHHGNGTQEIFWDHADVGYFSMHRWPFYPGTGSADEIGGGAGIGTTRNVPIAIGTPSEIQMQRFEKELKEFADFVKPQLLIVSAGFDSHKDDPIGSLGLESEDFQFLTRVVMDVADQHAGGKLVSALEGGYDPNALTECVAIHLQSLLDADPPPV
jgi:acetoin utilization deacetylase AcuC-like enzyme